MTERPTFSIVIPSKNRPDRVSDAAKSVLEQTYADLEVIVCDNSDEAESERTRERLAQFDDPRLRYVRTNGQLSMPDNWEFGLGHAEGSYVGILTDRSVFRRDALEIVQRELQTTGARIVNWYNDLYGRDPAGTQFKRRACTFKRYHHTRDEVLGYFLHGHPKYSNKIIPKLMTCVCDREILDEIRRSPAGRCCPPVAPDFTSGFLMLAHSDWVLTLDEALYVSVGTGNGADFRRRGELADRFRRDLGMEWHEMVDRMPSDACFAHALVQNDLMRVRDLVPDRLPGVEIDHAQYYLGCLNDYVKTMRHGVLRDEDLDSLLAALNAEPPEVQERVKITRLYQQATTPVSPEGEKKQRVSQRTAKVPRGADGDNPPPPFDDVFAALAWDYQNPRMPAAESFLDLQTGLDDLKKIKVRPPKVKPPRQEAAAEPVVTASGQPQRLRRMRTLFGRSAS